MKEKNDIKERTLLLGLKEEFQTNLKRVKGQINRKSKNLENAILLSDLMGPNTIGKKHVPYTLL